MGIDIGHFGGVSPLKDYHVLFKARARVYEGCKGVKLYTTKMEVLAGSKALEKADIVAYSGLSLDMLESVLEKCLDRCLRQFGRSLHPMLLSKLFSVVNFHSLSRW